MNFPRTTGRRRGFTLIEVMVAMTVTAMIVTILVSITAISLDTWTRSRSEVRAAAQAKALVDTMGRDFEALVNRAGTKAEWLTATAEPAESSGNGPNVASSNASKLIFYTSPTDRYDGEVGKDTSVGDVSCVGYELKYTDPIKAQGGREIPTFVLYRLLVNPDDTYEQLLEKANTSASSLRSAFEDKFQAQMEEGENFVCENIYQYTLTFNVTLRGESSAQKATPKTVAITLGNGGSASATEFRLEAGAITTDFLSTDLEASDEAIKAGSLTSVELSFTVMTDFGIEQMRQRRFKNSQEEADFMAKNSYQYSKLIPMASP